LQKISPQLKTCLTIGNNHWQNASYKYKRKQMSKLTLLKLPWIIVVFDTYKETSIKNSERWASVRNLVKNITAAHIVRQWHKFLTHFGNIKFSSSGKSGRSHRLQGKVIFVTCDTKSHPMVAKKK
jgi:hypothetical protein